MKRYGNLYDKVIAMDNLRVAEAKARKGKGGSVGVRDFDKDPERLMEQLHETLMAGAYRTSPYFIFKVFEPKERDIYRLPYYPDRITQHAIMNIMEPIYCRQFTRDTYSCIKGRGIHSCAIAVKAMLRRDPEGTAYCLKTDIRKFYPSIDHAKLKAMHRKILKDQRLLAMLDEIIDSTEGGKGIPIGNYLSQFFANFYLSPFDHWMKEERRVRHYARYADDMVVFAKTKGELHELLAAMREKLGEYSLDIKGDYQIFPTDVRGVDFVGYRFYPTHTLMRKSIKKNLAKKVALLNRKGHGISEREYRQAIAPWWGWAKHCDSKNLIKKLSKGSTYEIEFR